MLKIGLQKVGMKMSIFALGQSCQGRPVRPEKDLQFLTCEYGFTHDYYIELPSSIAMPYDGHCPYF